MESIYKRLLLATVFLFLISHSLFAAEITASALPAAAAAPFEKAQELEKDGKLIEARKIYEELLLDRELDQKSARQIRKSYEDLNVKLLFSKAEMPGTILHEVKPGESLSLLAQKYKTTVDLIKKSNGLTKDVIQAGKKLKVVNGTFLIKIDKSRNLMLVFLDGKWFKHYRIATGSHGGTPAGEFKIINKIKDPTWYKIGKVIPGKSPKNALGSRWLGFDNPGYGIHGTTSPSSIGQHTTSGCIRMLNEEVEELYLMVPIGTQVKVAD